RASTERDSLVRVHACRILSELGEWTPEQRKLATYGMQDPDRFVRRAAADALGTHPEADQVGLLLITIANPNQEKDLFLRHVAKIALRNQLLDDATLNQRRRWAREQSHVYRDWVDVVADACMGIRTETAGAFLLDQVERSTSTDRARISAELGHA